MSRRNAPSAESHVAVGDATRELALPFGKARLAVADPPYNNGSAYDAAIDDNKSYDAYMEWTRSWLTQVMAATTDDASVWVFIPDEWVSELDMMMRKDFRLHKRRHVVWTFTFGVACAKNFARSHCHILYMTKKKTRFVFNADAIRVPSARQLRYADKRANPAGKLPDATWMLLQEQLAPCLGGDGDTWLESRVCGTFKQRVSVSPNQIPVPLLQRIVRACSDPGDVVMDPFLGTGSTGVAAAIEKRKFCGYDLSQACVDVARQRILKEV